MADVKIVGKELTASVMAMLQDYTGEIAEGVQKAAKKAGRDCVKQLKTGKSSPQFQIHETGTRYNAGWAMKTKQADGSIEIIVHNKELPGLTHLLEKGHALPSGGRARAFVHIKPAEEAMIEQYERAVEEVIRNANNN